jgi:Beta-lactamase
VRSSLVIWLVTNAATVAFAATLGMATSQAQTVGKQSHSLVETAFDKAMRDWIAKHNVLRASAAVMRNGRLVFAAGYGARGANDRVAVWSLSKPITAVCVASLVPASNTHHWIGSGAGSFRRRPAGHSRDQNTSVLLVLQPNEAGLLGPEAFEFLRSAEGKWVNPARTIAYSLAVFVHLTAAGAMPNIFMQGGHNWGQNDAAGGPIDLNQGTSFVLAHDGVAWFASYEGLNAGTHPQVTSELDQAFWRAHDSISYWPEYDEFPAMRVGPIGTAR